MRKNRRPLLDIQILKTMMKRALFPVPFRLVTLGADPSIK